MHVAGRLGVLVQATGDPSEDGVLDAARNLRGERTLTQATGQRRDDLAHRQVRDEEVDASLHDPVELVAAGLGQVEFQEGARVTV